MNFFRSSKNKCVLLSSNDPLTLNKEVIYDSKKYYTISDISEELLDPKKKKESIFMYYSNICKGYDKVLLEERKYSFDLISISPKTIGRERSKSCSFMAKNTSGNSKKVLIQILSGNGYVIIQDPNDMKNIVVIEVSKDNYVEVKEDYAFLFINSSDDEMFNVLILRDSEVYLEEMVLKSINGAILYYTTSGFIKNFNADPSYELDDHKGNYIGDLSFDTQKGLYLEVMDIPEKFNFLK